MKRPQINTFVIRFSSSVQWHFHWKFVDNRTNGRISERMRKAKSNSIEIEGNCIRFESRSFQILNACVYAFNTWIVAFLLHTHNLKLASRQLRNPSVINSSNLHDSINRSIFSRFLFRLSVLFGLWNVFFHLPIFFPILKW